MNPSRDTADLEAATDQLVDEVCHRLSSLYGLLGMTLTEAGPAVDEIRARATELTRRLDGPHSRAAAATIARALWPPHPDPDIPRSWWATPLGALIARAARTPRAEAPIGARTRSLTGS